MPSSVTSVAKVHTQTAVQPSAERQALPEAKPRPYTTDTVQISVAARALQQRTEAAAQTVQAAAAGDVQAQAALEKPAARTVTR